jgi:hypothetical protein
MLCKRGGVVPAPRIGRKKWGVRAMIFSRLAGMEAQRMSRGFWVHAILRYPSHPLEQVRCQLQDFGATAEYGDHRPRYGRVSKVPDGEVATTMQIARPGELALGRTDQN